jgi:ketosteroid isomerase-like protein
MRITPPSIAIRFAVPLTAVFLVACGGTRISVTSESQTEQVAQREAASALLQYEDLVRTQNSKAISQLFTPNGKLEHVGQVPIVGRESIELFLDSFASYKVLSHEMKLTSVSSSSTQVSQSGTYVQHVRTPEGKEITASGWFLLQWQRQPDGKWLIFSARTSSSPLAGGASGRPG